MELKDLGNTPFRMSVLEAIYPDVTQLGWKAKRLEDNGDIIRLKRGLYVVSPTVSGINVNEFLLANHIYGPSYVSMQSALRYYDLIPEAVYKTISITPGLSKSYANRFGTFDYVHCSDEYYSVGIVNIADGKTSFMIASPEKALCDLLMFTPNLNLRYENDVRIWLEDELRFDMDELMTFDTDILKQCVAWGRKKNMINQIIKIIEHERNI